MKRILNHQFSYKTIMLLTIIIPALLYVAYLVMIVVTVYTFLTQGQKAAGPGVVTILLREGTAKQRRWVKTKLVVKK